MELFICASTPFDMAEKFPFSYYVNKYIIVTAKKSKKENDYSTEDYNNPLSHFDYVGERGVCSFQVALC